MTLSGSNFSSIPEEMQYRVCMVKRALNNPSMERSTEKGGWSVVSVPPWYLGWGELVPGEDVGKGFRILRRGRRDLDCSPGGPGSGGARDRGPRRSGGRL